jgi:hypothetical protein
VGVAAAAGTATGKRRGRPPRRSAELFDAASDAPGDAGALGDPASIGEPAADR